MAEQARQPAGMQKNGTVHGLDPAIGDERGLAAELM